MTRWPDGSVQHAMLSFWIIANGTVKVDFENGPCNDRQELEHLSAEDMMSINYEFSASIELSHDGVLQTADARSMLAIGDFRYWLSGPICTQIIIEDRTSIAKWDSGFNGDSEPFHPIFVATFYPGWSGVKIDAIGEVANTEAWQDMEYDLAIRSNWQGDVVYSTSNFHHFAGTRWRKTFYSGPAPQSLVIDLNFDYIVKSKALPNYDQSVTLSEARIATLYKQFNQTDRGDLGGSAGWSKYFPMSGGRPEIGLVPSFYLNYLYTFDERLREVMLGYAAASGSVPIHLREGDTSKGAAFGRPVSIDARPTLWAGDGRGWQTTEDQVNPIGPVADTGWTVDKAHQGGFAYVPYLVTGDWYFLEELYFWASFDLANADPCDFPGGICRDKDLGYIPAMSQLRGVAWALRNVAEAAFAAPDGTPEKKYLEEKLTNNVAVHEGYYGILGTTTYNSRGWKFGRLLAEQYGDNPLNLPMVTGGVPFADVDSSQVSEVGSPWMANFLYITLGHIEELGYPVGPWKTALLGGLLDRLTHPDCNPYAIFAYRMPLLDKNGKYLQSCSALMNAYLPEVRSASKVFGGAGDVSNGYPFIAYAATSFLPGLQRNGREGKQAWEWIKPLVNTGLFNYDPKWAIIPRVK